MPTNLTPEYRANLEAAHRTLLEMLRDARTDLANRPASQVYVQRVIDLEFVVQKVERALRRSRGEGDQS